MFDKNLEEFYTYYITKELYKSKFTLSRSINFNKITFLDKVNKSSYWFPANSGRFSLEYDNKLRLRKHFSKNSTYNFGGFDFLPTFEIFLNSKFNFSVSQNAKSSVFLSYLALTNELARRQELKKSTQDVRMYTVDAWKYRYYSKYSSFKYYYNFEPHRNLARINKFNFITVSNWIPVKRWLFTYRNMRNFYLKWRKTQKFEFKFYRAPGMSFRYWAKQQLQYNYLNSNSSDFLSDPYNSNIFTPPQVGPNHLDTFFSFNLTKYDHVRATFIYWLFIQLKHNSSIKALPAYFSNNYNLHQVSNSTKYKYLKNFFSYSTPKQAHVFYNKLNDAYGGWSELRNYFSLFKPSYWNLKKGLDLHPHEHWAWEDVLWWEDHVPLFFSRFTEKRREEYFSDLDVIDSANLSWFYKSWFHEDIYSELQASYYRTYYNIDYLTPGWRISTDFPKKKMGHFDPKWQERLQEYVIYPYMNLFYPSTKRYYIDYANHPDYVDSFSFIALNFSWKFNTLSPFHYKFRPKYRKILRSASEIKTQLDNFKPDFFSKLDNLNFISFFPLSFFNQKTWLLLDSYLVSLIFLVNVFTKNQSGIGNFLSKQNIDYLFFYLRSVSSLNITNKEFSENIIRKAPFSYSELLLYIQEFFFISHGELHFHRERIIVEYIAFKRFYSLLTSEYVNFK